MLLRIQYEPTVLRLISGRESDFLVVPFSLTSSVLVIADLGTSSNFVTSEGGSDRYCGGVQLL